MRKKILKKFDVLSADSRGTIKQLLDTRNQHIKSILYIVSKKRVVRGNHYHKNDIHYTYLLKGKFRYFERDAHEPKAKLSSRIISQGEMVASFPHTIHAMEFLEHSEMIVFTTESREQKEYERDTVRIKLV